MGEWDRSKFPLCGARTKAGEPCKMRSGQGTDHVGVGRCFKHGGASPAHRKAAAAGELQQRLHALSEPLADEQAVPALVLKELLKQAAGRMRYLDSEQATHPSEQAARLFERERQFLANIAKLASEVNVEQVEANIKQAQALLVANMIKDAAQLVGFSDADVEALGVALRVLLARHLGDASTAEAEAARLDTLREKLVTADEQRVRREAERLAGLIPAAEIGPGEDTAWLDSGQPSTP